jgi:hypothetical protein
MKKEDLQNSQQGTGSAENGGSGRDAQKHQATSIENDQQKDIAQQAGLGRDRMTDIEDLGGISGRDDYAGSDADDMSNQNTDEPTDR